MARKNAAPAVNEDGTPKARKVIKKTLHIVLKEGVDPAQVEGMIEKITMNMREAWPFLTGANRRGVLSYGLNYKTDEVTKGDDA